MSGGIVVFKGFEATLRDLYHDLVLYLMVL